MSEPFLAEVKIVGFNFAPRGWAFCDGQILPINQNQSLYSLLGTTYGGDGRTSFALPDLRGRVPIHVGTGHNQGQKSGTQTHTLTTQETPTHTHAFNVSTKDATQQRALTAGAHVLGKANLDLYRAPGNAQTLHPGAISSVGGSQVHNNEMPYLALHFCIALQGLFPSRN